MLPTVILPCSGYLAGFTEEMSLDKKIEKHLRIAKKPNGLGPQEAAEIQVEASVFIQTKSEA